VSRRRGILGVKRHNARSVQQSYTHSGHCVALRSSLRRQTAAALRGLLRLGLPPPVAMSWARRYLPPQCVFTHTEPTPKQKAGSSWTAGAVGACCVSARAALRVSAPVAMAAANGARPAASVRLFRCRLDRGPTTCLHLAAWVALFAHAPVLLAWLRQRHQARRIGSLLVLAALSGRHAPCRGWGRRASPRGTSAAMAAANSVSRVSSARFWCGGVNAKHPHDVTCAGAGCRERQCLFCLLASAGSAGRCRKSISRRQPLSRRPPLCGPCGYCLRQTPSVPPIGYRERLRSSATGSGAVARIVGLT